MGGKDRAVFGLFRKPLTGRHNRQVRHLCDRFFLSCEKVGNPPVKTRLDCGALRARILEAFASERVVTRSGERVHVVKRPDDSGVRGDGVKILKPQCAVYSVEMNDVRPGDVMHSEAVGLVSKDTNWRGEICRLDNVFINSSCHRMDWSGQRGLA